MSKRMHSERRIIKYTLEFLVVFLGILLSFGIDNYVKQRERINQKNTLLIELRTSINEDQEQLIIVEDALNVCLESFDLLIRDQKKPFLSDSAIVANISNVSAKMAISFFPQTGIYNQLIQTESFELIESEDIKRSLSDLFEHLGERNNSANLKFDSFAQKFDLVLTDKLFYRLVIQEVDNSVDLNAEITDFFISKNYQNHPEIIGMLTNGEKRVYFYKELLKKYDQLMKTAIVQLDDYLLKRNIGSQTKDMYKS